MTDVFVVKNQLGHYWGKSKCWVDGSQPRLVLKTTHKDEAVNILVELSSKDFELRGNVVSAELNERGEPIIEPSQIPLPIDPEAEVEAETEREAEMEVADTGTAENDLMNTNEAAASDAANSEPHHRASS